MHGENIADWVQQASSLEEKEFRQAVHTLLKAISLSQSLKERMLLKGGILMAIGFHSTRFTRDVDFSTDKKPSEENPDATVKELERSLALAVVTLDYDLDCRIQGSRLDPNRDDATFPTLSISVGYAKKGSKKHVRLLKGQSPTTLKVDHSFFEENIDIAELDFDDGTIRAYSLPDLVAEKYRALLQQKVRNRTRRQDAYDIYWLLSEGYLKKKSLRKDVLRSLRRKAKSRAVDVHAKSLRDPEIIERSQREYHQLGNEIQEDLPPFSSAYKSVKDYYESLPWEKPQILKK
jgi:predicted nucleotidyltransferase component of viral defense system